MSTVASHALTPQEVEEVAASWDNQPVKVFCVDGVIVVVPVKEALKRLPYDVMTLLDQPTMAAVLHAQGKDDVFFLSPLTSDHLIREVPSVPGSLPLFAYPLENINKTTVNMVSASFGAKEVFGPDQDGVLRDESNDPV